MALPEPPPLRPPEDPPATALQAEVASAQARRIRDLERCLAERTRVLTQAAQSLALEISRRDEAHAALLEAQKVEAIGHLAGGLAHDLRNVLNTLALGFGLLETRKGDELLAHVAVTGRRALTQADGLVESMLGFMRRNRVRVECIAPQAWLVKMGDLLRFAAGTVAHFTVEAPEDLWPIAVEDHALGSTLINLLVNARDAMPDGGDLTLVAANLRKGNPRPAAVPEGDFVVFSVRDTGCGMAPDLLARATEPLFSTKAAGKGTGLGLHMASRFAHASRGHLHLASKVGVGTQADLFLPRCQDVPLVAPNPAWMAQPRLAPSAVILLVEDNDLLRPGLAALLRDQGHQVQECDSAEVAMALIHTLPSLHLVITEVDLPGADGAALILNLRQARPGLPALLIASGALLRSPLPDVPLLHKPLLPADMVEAVQEILRKGRSPRDKEAGILDRLVTRIHSPALLSALIQWRASKGSAPLPEATTILGLAQDLEDWRFVATVEGPRETPSFSCQSVGPALAAMLASHGGDKPAADLLQANGSADTLGSLVAAYHRAAHSCLPTYEYLRYRLPGGPPVEFERLILPATRDGQTLSHLIGFVFFHNLS